MKSYEEQRKELEARVSESEEAVLRAHSMRRNVEHLVRKEQEAFDALLKNPDFQRWLRLMHEAWRGCAWCRKVEAVGFRQHGHVRLPICAECIGSAERGKPPLGTPPAWLNDETPKPCDNGGAPAPKPCPYAVLGCDARSRCEDCRKDEAPQNVYTCCGMPATGTHAPCCPNHTAPATPRCTCTHSTAIDYHDKACPMFPAWVQRKYENAAKNAPQPKAPALSPRQALGEALAAVDRALSLLQSAYRSGTRETVDAMNDLKSAGDKLARAYEAAK